jgi:NAD(P)-dependent dehydrogenase (short-subunit alcohol dehydrogenase family)
MDTGLGGKVVVVTGAAAGIGRATALRFAEEGARIAAWDVTEAAAAGLLAEIASAGGTGAFTRVDVAKAADVESAVHAVIDRWGRIDVLVNNAGIVHAADFLDLTEEDFDRVLRVNLKGAFLCGQAAARQMAQQQPRANGERGVIVNMSSVNAVLAIANQVPYTVSKGGVNQLTKVMALALAPHAIRVTAIGPGSIATEMLRTAVMTNEAARDRILSRTPMKRLGEPEEIARIAVFLASDDASYVTGTTVYADGGRLGLNYTV